MKMARIVLVLFLFISSNIHAQIDENAVLFTVDKKPITAKEFLRVYNKNLDLVKDESQKDVDEYLNLFVNYSMKLAEAKALGYDKTPEYLREFESYKKQLSRNYLTDNEVTDALVEEAYERISYDIKASHILIKFPENETDTAFVYKTMLGYKDRLMNEDFDKLKTELHNGKSVFVEDLGYFSGFKMVYDFETVAFNTPTGQVSDPFRTQFGYHVLKVHDKRPSRGEVTVGHIMISNASKSDELDPAQRIKEIYKMIKQGETFEDLAKQFSDDQSSAQKGGKLNPFKSGQLSSVEFEDMAFSLQEVGQISEPFKTDYGWHIAKLYNKKPIEPFSKLKGRLESRVKSDSRSRKITEAFVDSLVDYYNVTSDVDLSYFVSMLTEDYFIGTWTAPDDVPEDLELFTIDAKKFTYQDFTSFLQRNQKRIREKQSFNSVINGQYKEFLKAELLKYHEANLENVNEDYAQVLGEYRDGLLLFDLMEKKVWNAVKEDSVGIQNYYDANKDKYVWPERIDAVIATSVDAEILKKVIPKLEANEDLDGIKKEINTEGAQNIMFTSGIIQKDHRLIPNDFDLSVGISEIYALNNANHVIQVKEIIPSSQKTLDEAKGKVISDYQREFEQKWLDDLAKKYEVKIDQSVLQMIKEEIAN